MKYVKLLMVSLFFAVCATLRADEWSSWKTVPDDQFVVYRVKCGAYNSDSKAYKWSLEFKNKYTAKVATVKLSFYRRNKSTGEWELTGNNREQHTLQIGESVTTWCFYPDSNRVEFSVHIESQ
jgi:hypothetical protein